MNLNPKNMSEQELKEYVAGTYDVCLELIRRAGYWPKWQAIGWEFDNHEDAFLIASAIAGGNKDYIDQCFVDVWDNAARDAAGISEEEYEENPETPLWEREDWVYNETTEEWEQVEDEEDEED